MKKKLHDNSYTDKEQHSTTSYPDKKEFQG